MQQCAAPCGLYARYLPAQSVQACRWAGGSAHTRTASTVYVCVCVCVCVKTQVCAWVRRCVYALAVMRKIVPVQGLQAQ